MGERALIHHQETEPSQPQFDALIVLGAPVVEDKLKTRKDDLTKGYDLSFDAKLRTLAAAEAYHQGLTNNLIFSGGKTSGENLPSEGEAMRDYILQHFKNESGPFKRIPPEALLMEARAYDTTTNLRNTNEIVEANGWKNVGILTNNYHLPRALLIAENQGLNVKQVSAEELLIQKDESYKKIIDRYYSSPAMLKKRMMESVLMSLLRIDPHGNIQRTATRRTRK